jgi:hypothetical protein
MIKEDPGCGERGDFNNPPKTPSRSFRVLDVITFRDSHSGQRLTDAQRFAHQRQEKASTAPLSTVRCMGGLGRLPVKLGNRDRAINRHGLA